MICTEVVLGSCQAILSQLDTGRTVFSAKEFNKPWVEHSWTRDLVARNSCCLSGTKKVPSICSTRQIFLFLCAFCTLSSILKDLAQSTSESRNQILIVRT